MCESGILETDEKAERCSNWYKHLTISHSLLERISSDGLWVVRDHEAVEDGDIFSGGTVAVDLQMFFEADVNSTMRMEGVLKS